MKLIIGALALCLTTSQAIAQDDTPSELPLEELRKFTQIYEQIRLNYVTEMDDQTMLENAIKGMVSNLDPHSTYLTKSNYSELRDQSEGAYSGIGVEVSGEAGAVRIVTPLDGSPAAEAGLLPGDLIVQFNGEPVQIYGVQKTIDDLRGEEGSGLKLGIIREGHDGVMQMELTRGRISISSVRSQLMNDTVGYIRVSQFQVNSGKDVGTELQALTEQGAKSIILDLRNNPGGVIQAAADMVDVFMDPALVVYTEGQMEQNQQRLSGITPDQSDGIPLVVLINEGSASASEIVAGALKDHGRAVLVGTRTFGKGSVQSVVPISEDTAIKLTTALFFTPNGRSIQAQGIMPDIIAERARIESVQPRNLRISEVSLTRHLSNGNGEEDVTAEQRLNDETMDQATDLFKRDNQLFTALNVAKTLEVTRQ